VDFATPLPMAGLADEVPSRLSEAVRDEPWHALEARKEADRVVLAKYAVGGVLVDENFDVIQFRGDTSPYLEHAPGDPSLNLLKMARGALVFELRSLLLEARHKATPVKKDGITVQQGANLHTIQVEVTPFHLPSAKTTYFLVLFQEPAAVKEEPLPLQKESEKSGVIPSEALEKHLGQVKSELTTTKQHLQGIIEEQEATNEELQSANEEILSSNEELQSINEELETAKEELQSSNEELTTVNEELQNRNSELSEVNDDLTNLLSSVSIPIVMLSSDQRIRRFTPLAERMLSLIPTDVGRPIGDIKPRINLSDLEGIVAEVLDTATVRELEVQDREGRWYSMRVRPYKTRENKIDGAVIALLDIDLMKRTMEQLKDAGALNGALLRAVHEPVMILDDALNVHAASQAFYDYFRLSPSEVSQGAVTKLLFGKWLPEALKAALENTPGTGDNASRLEITHDFPKIGERRLHIEVRRLDHRENAKPLYLVVFDEQSPSHPRAKPA
jgi:two-component system CheB/CheR fusion protein